MNDTSPHSQAAELLRLGHLRSVAGDTGNAFALLRGALDCEVDYAKAYHNLGGMVTGPGRYDAAIACAKRAIACKPDDPTVWMLWLNLAIALYRAQRFDEQKAALDKARALRPGHFGIEHNLGIYYYATGQAALAIETLQGALRLPPDVQHCRGDTTVSARNDLAHAVLKSGDLARGLDMLEMRWDGMLTKSPIWDCGLLQWNSGAIASTLLLHHEQGFGDTLQFVRFIPAIKKASGASRVIFAAPKPLHRLLKDQCGIDELIDFLNPGEIVKAALRSDYHCPLLSAVAVLKPGFDTLDAAPYLSAPVTTDRAFHKGGTTLAVGLVWAASPGHERSRQRSVPVNELLELATVPGVRLWSLQFAPFKDDLIATGAEYLIEDGTVGINDFADTAAVLKKLDVVVAVDTSIVHLAGALGVPCFMLNPINPCWRWCKGGAVWYGAMELFDQVTPENWHAPIAAIKERVAAMTAGRTTVSLTNAGASYPRQPVAILDGKVQLPDVTLVMFDAPLSPLTAMAARESRKRADFGAAVIFADSDPGVDDAMWIAVNRGDLDSALSQRWKLVPYYLNTTHALFAEWDSWIINPESWDQAFLEYDYIGAPWGWHGDGHEVGNGGFSLRSAKLLRHLVDHADKYPFVSGQMDDVLIARTYRSALEADGFRFAPLHVAKRFSVERSKRDGTQCVAQPIGEHKPFGFHGLFNFDAVLSDAEIAERIKLAPVRLLETGHYRELKIRLAQQGRPVPQRVAREPSSDRERILLRRDGAFGDVLALTPIVHRLRQEKPHAAIHVLTAYPGVFAGNPDVDHVSDKMDLLVDGGYDRVVDLNNAIENRHHRVAAIECYMEDVFGDRCGDKTVRVAKVPRPYIYALAEGADYVTMHPAVSWQNRTLPAAFWQRLADRIIAQGYMLVVIGTSHDHKLHNVVDARDVLSIQQQAAMIAGSRAFVASDSGPMMLMAATETPAVALCTISVPASSTFWRHGEPNWRVRAIWPKLPCVGCSGRIASNWRHHGCERGDFACVDAFDPQEVATAVLEMANAPADRELVAAE